MQKPESEKWLDKKWERDRRHAKRLNRSRRHFHWFHRSPNDFSPSSTATEEVPTYPIKTKKASVVRNDRRFSMFRHFVPEEHVVGFQISNLTFEIADAHNLHAVYASGPKGRDSKPQGKAINGSDTLGRQTTHISSRPSGPQFVRTASHGPLGLEPASHRPVTQAFSLGCRVAHLWCLGCKSQISTFNSQIC